MSCVKDLLKSNQGSCLEQPSFADPHVAELVIPLLMQFWDFYNSKSAALRSVLSIRDLLAWARFVDMTAPSFGPLPAYAHGAYLVLLDGIGLGIGMQMEVIIPLDSGFQDCRALPKEASNSVFPYL